MGKIKLLSDEVINQIAAGEVIARPASCVKEMLENAIDAGATSITVKIEKAGKALIEVKDNGSGMSGEDAKNAFLRHATSKIKSAEDLNGISTLGFRGEALASIASISKIEILTKTDGDEAGTYLYMEGGKVKKEEKKTSNTGTIIKVRDIFYNTPARLKFLKSDYTEEIHIVDTVVSQGLAKENVSFNLTVDDRELVFFPQKSFLKDRIRIIYGKEIYDALIPLAYYSDSIKVEGFITKPEVSKASRNFQFLFVNGRNISNRSIMFALSEGYGTFLMRGKYPVAFLFLEVNPAAVDVNVHPTKAEVKFREDRLVFNAVKKAVEEALQKAELTPYIGVENVPPENRANPFSPEGVKNALTDYFASEQAQLFDGKKAYVQPDTSAFEVKSQKRPSMWMRALGQLHKTYIIGEDEGNIIIIDQHAAHEKVLYERVSEEIENGKLKIQEMLIHEIVHLTPQEKLLVDKNIIVFEKAGFTFEPFGENDYKVSAQPVMIKHKAAEPFIREIIESIKEKNKADIKEILRDIAARVACRAAVKAGDELGKEEIEALLEEYFESEAPYSCPHGRPAMIKIPFDEVEKMFKRKL